MRWLRRGLERHLAADLKVVERAGDEAAVERFLAMEASGWKGQAGTAMACIPGRAQFFREMCAGFAADNRLRMLCYEAGGVTLAMKCDIAAGDGLFCVKKTYDENFARFSPGVLLEIEGLGVFHDSDASWMDSCTHNTSDPLFRLWPDTATFTNMLVTLDGAVGWLAMHASPAVLALLRRLRPAKDVRPSAEPEPQASGDFSLPPEVGRFS
jgi:hypothetical protein